MSLFEGLKNLGGALGKGFLIEAYIAYYEDDLIQRFKEILDQAAITADDIPEFVINHRALPIPQKSFTALRGFEDYIETLEAERLYEWLTKARPDLGLALAACGDEGADYMARLKYFFADSIRTSPPPREEAPPPDDSDTSKNEVDQSSEPSQEDHKYPVRCNDCDEVFSLTKAEIAALTECPNCGAPANLQL